MIDSCKNCENFEERRDIDGVSLCANNRGPGVSCARFKPNIQVIDFKKVDYGFCLECNNFEELNGNSLCANCNYPGIACEMFEQKIR